MKPRPAHIHRPSWQPPPTPLQRAWRRALPAAAAWGLAAGVMGWSVQGTLSRSVVALAVVVGGALWARVVWDLRMLRRAAGVSVVALAVAAAVVSQPVPRGVRVAAYVEALQHREGAPYMWGGEGPDGVDCSGLVRAALWSGLGAQAAWHADVRLLADMVALWWNDTPAVVMLAGAQGMLVPVVEASSVRTLNASALQRGDLAVTRDGRHVMAFVGDARWIQADPVVGRVHIQHVDGDSPWWRVPVRVLRWRWLAAPQRDAAARAGWPIRSTTGGGPRRPQ